MDKLSKSESWLALSFRGGIDIMSITGFSRISYEKGVGYEEPTRRGGR